MHPRGMRGGKTIEPDERDKRGRDKVKRTRKPKTDRGAEPASKLLRQVGRYLLWAILLLVFVRGVGAIFAGDPERTTRADAGSALRTPSFPDDEARAFAVQFTRAYLTFAPEHPEYHELSVRPFVSAPLREDGALELPVRGPSQTVTSATVARAKPLGDNRALVTIAATVVNRTITTRYLTVPVARDANGGLTVYDYPAFSSPPPVGEVDVPEPSSLDGAGSSEISDLMTRFFAAYLDARQLSELAYFLARDARVIPLEQRYRLRRVLGVAQVGEGTGPTRIVLVTVRARDPETRADYTLRYRVELVRRDRWYVKTLAGSAS